MPLRRAGADAIREKARRLAARGLRGGRGIVWWAKTWGRKAALAGALAASLLSSAQAQASNVDVALVFAIDYSSSIDPDIADLQRKGHAAALTSPEVIAAISRNYLGCISISYLEWSSSGRARIVLPWTRICSLKEAEAAASVIDTEGDTGFSRRGRGRTSVSFAIDVASLLLDQFPGEATRKVIDISSNGENNDGIPVHLSRQRAVAKGYTINAIVIPAHGESDRQLASYFAEQVIGGPQSFVEAARGPGDYRAALRRKLVTEISMAIEPAFANGSDEPSPWACRYCR